MMVMDYLKRRAEEAAMQTEVERPSWVTDQNASLRAWEYVEQLKKEKALYVKRHHKVTDYLTKKAYQIKGADVANALNISRASLMNTSSYSPHFRDYLDNVNAELEAAKETKLRTAQKSTSRGSIRSRKDELVQANAELRKKVTELEKQKTEELVRYAFDQLPLPVKKKLGID
ncbi:hypothetical protein [Motiliproteus sediminis]|uniref:hypothetical protein n=1 Tax=Motiliproteus sediminis TaxID=1468178 RepID=UPI001AEFDF63|nr:hypothetical protein [Motiliproteus sediminis]